MNTTTDCPTCRERAIDDAAFERRFVQDLVSWPDAARCATAFFIDFQGSEGLQPGANGRVDYEEFMTREYGPRTGIWRLLRVLKSHGVKATFAVTGAIAQNYPEAVLAIQEDGHEIAGHGYHHEVASRIGIEEERQAFAATITELERITGQRIQGWRNCHESASTRGLGIEHGLKWNSNSFSYDFPFVLMKGDRSIIEIPRHPHGDIRHRNPADFSTNIWQTSFDTFYEESAEGPTFAPVTLHPFAAGRPWAAQAVSRLISHVQQHDGARFMTVSEIADCVIEASARPVAVPV